MSWRKHSRALILLGVGAFLLYIVNTLFLLRIQHYELSEHAINSQHTEKYQTTTRGPISLTIVQFSELLLQGLAFIGHALHEFHQEILGAFTIALVIVTWLLARYTKGLWRETSELVKEAKSSSARQAIQTQESIENLAKAGYAMQDIANAMSHGSLATGRSADATNALVERTRVNAERQLRAYVGIPTITLNRVKINGIDQEFLEVVMKNYGQTPAHKFHFWLNVSQRELPLKGDLPRLDNAIVGAIGSLAPTCNFDARVVLPLMDGAAIDAGTEAAYIYGTISYTDVFAQEWKTNFRFYQRGPGWNSEGDWYVHKEGNDAT